MMRAGVLCLVLTFAGCGSMGDSNSSDGGPYDDAGAGCSFSFAITPTTLTAPVTVVATAVVTTGGLSGFQNFVWTVSFLGTPITPTDSTGDLSEISFAADQPGEYRIALSGDIAGRECAGNSTTVNVIDPTAGSVQYRLRLVPAPGQPAPVQERVIRVFGGVNSTLDSISLDNGTQVGATLTGPGGTGRAAYMRVSQVGGLGGDVETFADAAGQFSLWLTPALHDILVVPADATLAPMRFQSVDVTTLSELTLAQGDAVTGTVLDGAGQPLANARVSLRIDGVPSTIATTDGAGAFTVFARTGAATVVSVVPPVGSGLPQLELAATAGLTVATATPLVIRYDAGLTSRTVSLAITQADTTTPVPMASVTWVADNLSAVGTVTPMGASALVASGRVRVTTVADGTGAIANVNLPETSYTVLVQPTSTTAASELLALVSVDLSAGMTSPPSLALSPGAIVSGVVRNATQEAIGGIRVTAAPRGLIANSPTTSALATTAADGSYALIVVAGASYDLRFDSPSNSHGQVVQSVDSPAAGMSVARDAELPMAIQVTGMVSIPGIPGGAGGVSVSALCFDCTGPQAVRPKAQAISGANGVFVLAIPNPKIKAPAD